MHFFRREHVVIVRFLQFLQKKCRLASQKRRQWWQEHWRVSNCRIWKTSSRISSYRNYLHSEDKKEWLKRKPFLCLRQGLAQDYFQPVLRISDEISWSHEKVRVQSSIYDDSIFTHASCWTAQIIKLLSDHCFSTSTNSNRTIFYYSLCNINNTRRLVPNHSKRNCLKIFQSKRDWNRAESRENGDSRLFY